MARTFEATVEMVLTITVNDENVIDRCVENHDSNGVPQPDEKGSNGWRNHLYDLRTAEEVIRHLAFNYVASHAVAHELDGWADLTVDWRNPYMEYEIDRQSVEIDVAEQPGGDADA